MGFNIDITLDDGRGLKDGEEGSSDETDDDYGSIYTLVCSIRGHETILLCYLAIWCERGCVVLGLGMPYN